MYSGCYEEFRECIKDLINAPIVLSLDGFAQHSDITRFEHSVFVAYISFKICKKLRLDAKSAARGGILHDLFLYEARVKEGREGWHGFRHPKISLNNAVKNFKLNDIEKDIILKHMWPLTLSFPRYAESVIVNFVDTYCAIIELLGIVRRMKLRFVPKLIKV